jgi:hypothetical protein
MKPTTFVPCKPTAGFRTSPGFTFERRENRIVVIDKRGIEYCNRPADELANTMYGRENQFTWGAAFEADALDVDGYGFLFAHRRMA